MRALCIAAVCILAISTSVAGQQKCKEYAPQGSVLAFCPPADWSAAQEKGEKHLTFTKNPGPNQFPAEMAVKEDPIDGPIEIMAWGMIRSHLAPDDGPQKMTDKRVTDASDFTTASGVTGLRVVTEAMAGNVPVRMAFYIFDGPGKIKVTFICTSAGNDAAARTAIEQAVKTLRIGK